MKKILIFTLALAAFAGCQKRAAGDFVIKGHIGTLGAPAMAYLGYHTADGEVLDSAAIVGGKFTIKGNTPYPASARLAVAYNGEGMGAAIHNGQYKLLYVGDDIIVESADSLSNAVVTSPLNTQYDEYVAFIGGQPQELAAKMNAKVAAATEEERADSTFYPRLDAEYRAMLAERANKQREYARTNPTSYFSVVALGESANMQFDTDEVEGLLKIIDAKWQNTPDAVALQQRINAVRNIVVGKPAPDFTQNTIDGRPVSLSDFRGKWVLLDFWASWCGPCRAESPHLVKAIADFGSRGFDVLGVSLDKAGDKAAWEKAMADDGYTWTNISDLKGWNNSAAQLYGIRAIPQNYLIDPEGNIAAINLRGEKLGEKLAEILPSEGAVPAE